MCIHIYIYMYTYIIYIYIYIHMHTYTLYTRAHIHIDNTTYYALYICPVRFGNCPSGPMRMTQNRRSGKCPSRRQTCRYHLELHKHYTLTCLQEKHGLVKQQNNNILNICCLTTHGQVRVGGGRSSLHLCCDYCHHCVRAA